MIKTHSIVIKTTKFRESSLIFDAYTKESGLMSFIAGGVRKPRARIPGSALQIGNELEIVAYPSKTELHRVKTAQILSVYRRIPLDVRRGAVLTFCIEVFRNSLQGTEKSELMFGLLRSYIESMDAADCSLAYLPLQFLLALTDPIGITPNLGADLKCFDLREGITVQNPPIHMDVIEGTQLDHLRMLRRDTRLPSMTREERKELLRALIQYFQIHQPGFRPLKSLDILHTIF